MTFYLPVFATLLWTVASSPVKDSSGCMKYPCIIFEDNFDWFNLDTWEHEITAGGGGNYEFQYYHNNRSNSYVKNGILHIKPTLSEERFGKDWPYYGTLDLWGHTPADVCTGNLWNGCFKQASGNAIVNPIQSARIRTARSFAFRYGRWEVNAKLPRGDWLWPAIWMLPRYQKYGSWPSSGEIDLVEARGNADITDSSGNHCGIKQMGSTLHFGPYVPENAYWSATKGKLLTNGRTFADDFHKFRMDWDETGMKFYVDDEELMNVETGKGYWVRGQWDKRLGNDTNVWAQNSANLDAPFDQEFYFILNVAVGGTGGYFGDWIRHPPYPKPWSDRSGPTAAMRQFWDNRNTWLPTWSRDDDNAMQIDYIRVWKLKEDCWLTKPPTCQ